MKSLRYCLPLMYFQEKLGESYETSQIAALY